MMRTVLIAGVVGLFVMGACERSSEAADTADTATMPPVDSAEGMSETPLAVVSPAPIVDSARMRDSLRAKARRDSARAQAKRDSVKGVMDRAIANRRRY